MKTLSGFIFEPTALAFLSAICNENLPVLINFCLISFFSRLFVRGLSTGIDHAIDAIVETLDVYCERFAEAQ
jgi:hypothetical protein